MKYNEKNPPIKCYMHQSTWLQEANSNCNPVGVLWHDTGAGNPNIKRYVQPDDNAPDKEEMIALIGYNKNQNDKNHTDSDVCANAYIGKLADGSIATVQVGPLTTEPWSCGKGKYGSCNGYIFDSAGNRKWVSNFWHQFEICDDGYKSQEYFEEAYKEACEYTAYLCKLFHIDPMGTVIFNGVRVPTILCHKDSYALGLGSNHGDVISPWFTKFGKTMDDVRKDVKELLDNAEPIKKEEIYRVRKSWKDSKSQVGAYKVLEYAIEACEKAGYGYSVFNSSGELLYSAKMPEEQQTKPSVGTGADENTEGDTQDNNQVNPQEPPVEEEHKSLFKGIIDAIVNLLTAIKKWLGKKNDK